MKKILVLIIAIVSAFSFASCKKKPIIGYEPEIPPEWQEEAEKEKNNPYTELVKTTTFDGVWKQVSTGKLYYFYNGHIFEVDSADDIAEAPLWGTVVIVQTVEKEKLEEYENKMSYEAGEEIVVNVNSSYSDINKVKLIAVEEGKVKIVLPDGNEQVYKFIKTAEVWPEGFQM